MYSCSIARTVGSNPTQGIWTSLVLVMCGVGSGPYDERTTPSEDSYRMCMQKCRIVRWRPPSTFSVSVTIILCSILCGGIQVFWDWHCIRWVTADFSRACSASVFVVTSGLLDGEGPMLPQYIRQVPLSQEHNVTYQNTWIVKNKAVMTALSHILHLFFQNFYKNEINRKEMYLRYIYKLHDLHLPAENYTEAGFTMKLYADQLSWTARTLVSDPHCPGQQEWQRKEQLYHQIIKYFDSGKVNITHLVQWITVPFVEKWYLTCCVLNDSDI